MPYPLLLLALTAIQQIDMRSVFYPEKLDKENILKLVDAINAPIGYFEQQITEMKRLTKFLKLVVKRVQEPEIWDMGSDTGAGGGPQMVTANKPAMMERSSGYSDDEYDRQNEDYLNQGPSLVGQDYLSIYYPNMEAKGDSEPIMDFPDPPSYGDPSLGEPQGHPELDGINPDYPEPQMGPHDYSNTGVKALRRPDYHGVPGPRPEEVDPLANIVDTDVKKTTDGNYVK